MQVSLARNSHGGEFDNTLVVTKTAMLRAQRATLLGYANHAAYQLEDQTAKDVATVNKLLSDLAPAAGPAASPLRVDSQRGCAQAVDRDTPAARPCRSARKRRRQDGEEG